MATVGFLHTSDVHVPTFRSLLADQAPDLDVIDAVDKTLLDDAQLRGIDQDISERLRDRLVELRDRGSSVVVCTCSTLGGAAEQLTNAVGIPVVRIDRPMAQRAAAIGGRIAVVVAVPSSLALTRHLLIECIASARTEATLIEAPCLDAWHLFQAGDIAGYVERVGAHARRLADRADVIVLAQASMAPVADQLTDLPVAVAVLCSPAIAAERAIAVATGNLRR